MNLKRLTIPFDADDISWRIQQSGIRNEKPWAKCLAYVTNRAIMNRLDEVCGMDGWELEKPAPGPDGGVLSGIRIKTDNGWLTKWDGAENTNVEAVKGGLSDSMKRAGYQWGIGRYLYDLVSGWAKFVDGNGRYQTTIKDDPSKTYYHWNPPELPVWALPEPHATKEQVVAIKELSQEEGIATEKELFDFIGFMRAGERLTEKEGVELVNNFHGLYQYYIKTKMGQPDPIEE